MKQEEFFKIMGIILISIFIIYIFGNVLNLMPSKVVEGLTSGNDALINDGAAPVSGEAGTASSYAAAVKAQVVKLQDELLTSKYRNEYETAIINLDEYIGYLMLQQTLNLGIGGNSKSTLEALANLNTLKNAKDSLNSTMVFLDKT